MENTGILNGLFGVVCGFGAFILVLMIKTARSILSIDKTIRESVNLRQEIE